MFASTFPFDVLSKTHSVEGILISFMSNLYDRNKRLSSTISLRLVRVEERVVKTETFAEKKIINIYNFFV